MSTSWIKIAAIYLVIGIIVGIIMAIAMNFTLGSAHAHVNVVGFATTAIFGIIYCIFPKTATNTLGKAHFWFHNLGVPVFLLGAFFVYIPGWFVFAHVLIYVGAIAFGIGAIIFIVNAFTNIHHSAIRQN